MSKTIADSEYNNSSISGIVIGIGGSSRSSSINQKDLKIAARRLYSLGRYRKQNLKVRPLEAPVHGGSCRAGRPAVAVNLDIFYLENQGIPCSKVFAGRRRRRRRRRSNDDVDYKHIHHGTSETSDIGSPFIGFSQKECEAQVRRPCAWGLLKTTPQNEDENEDEEEDEEKEEEEEKEKEEKQEVEEEVEEKVRRAKGTVVSALMRLAVIGT
ncbi:hypothetical protein HZH68_014016 [Vespula germanica]|uniref:Uncharacterized protein n=1 Tax=Vespula germanica TaxID=30212 RepID=A0A834JDC6_VESGE|nr:hypothetical protein HZH68_014016 [Vespula germanica]